jgi:steroid 5-alpha reductase family enzyme
MPSQREVRKQLNHYFTPRVCYGFAAGSAAVGGYWVSVAATQSNWLDRVWGPMFILLGLTWLQRARHPWQVSVRRHEAH